MPESIDPTAFRAKYGPWALIAGASDGTGAAFARQLAAIGLNLILVARRAGPLEALAHSLEQAHGISTRIATIDLSDEDASARVVAAAKGVEVGLFVSNAGADTDGRPFLDAPLHVWRQLIARNVCCVAESVHQLANLMRPRGRGGVVLMSSGTALGGQPGVAVYSGTKAFDLNLSEGLWGELRPHGIDVLGAVCPAMNTPTLQKTLAVHQLTVPGLYEPDDVVRTLLARLPDGPIHIFPFGPDAPRVPQIERDRRDRVSAMLNMTQQFFGKP